MEPIPETVRAIEELGPFASDDDLLDQLNGMADRVTEIVPDCIGMSVASSDHGVTFTLVAPSERIALLDALQYLDGGPCVDAVEQERVVAVSYPDLTDESAWRLLNRASTQLGVASSLSLPVVTDGRVTGSINLYGASTSSFLGHHDELAGVLGAWAAGAVADADLAFATRLLAQDAPRLLRTSSTLEDAVDMVAAIAATDRDTAGQRLGLAARRAGIGPAQLAEALLKLGLG
jgi:GAF domain-containing protein